MTKFYSFLRIGAAFMRKVAVLAVRALLAVCLLSSSQWVSAQVLTVTPLTWNVIGLDSNKPLTSGPDTFPVGARVCNVGAATANNLTATFILQGGSGAAIINSQGPTTLTYPALPAGAAPPSQYTTSSVPPNCTDFYFTVVITRAATSYDKTRTYQITASASNAATVSTPPNRELYVEHLVSQARNSGRSISGPSTVFVGDTVSFVYQSATAPGGYEQLESFIAWPGASFQVLSVTSTYVTPAGAVNSSPYADACNWQNDPTIVATYRSCTGTALNYNYPGGKAGGDPINTTYVVKVIAPSAAPINSLIHDFSGSAYHYNSDFGTGAGSLALTAKYRQSDLAITKTDNKTSALQNSTTTYTLVVTNSGPDAAVTTTVADPAVSGLQKTSVTCSASGGTACPSTVTVASIESGVVVASTPVGSTLTFTVVATVTASSGTVTNVATVTPSTLVIDSNSANNTATDADAVIGLVNLTINKSNGVGTVTAGSTTSYTVTVANLGPADASGAKVQDSPSLGLACTTVSCTSSNGAACPTNLLPEGTPKPTLGGTTIFSGAGETIPSFPSGVTVTLRLTCNVSASGQ